MDPASSFSSGKDDAEKSVPVMYRNPKESLMSYSKADFAQSLNIMMLQVGCFKDTMHNVSLSESTVVLSM